MVVCALQLGSLGLFDPGYLARLAADTSGGTLSYRAGLGLACTQAVLMKRARLSYRSLWRGVVFGVLAALPLVGCNRAKEAAPRQQTESGLEVTPVGGGEAIPIDLEGAPARGGSEARIVIVEYSNFRCKPCAKMARTLSGLAAENPGRLRLIFKHGLLGEAAASYLVHEAAQAAAAQGKFWEYEELLFSRQMAFSEGELKGYAAEVGLDVPRFEKELASHVHRGAVDRDFYEADLLGHKGTPVIYVNGRGYFGLSDAEIKQKVEAALAECKAERSC
jgi:protein-disulfide isomerase